MILKIPKFVFFILTFAIGLFLYWSSMNGTPIWDDYVYWFEDTNMEPHMSYWSILLNFGWPISVSIQKILFGFFQKNYFIYHLINYLLHFINSVLVYKIARHMKFKYPFLYSTLFLLHPSAVITTAWMIQIKTLLCFLFAFSSILFFLKGEKKFKWLVVSWFFFFLSVGSKSASLLMPLVLFAIHYRFFRWKNIHYLIPYFLISIWGTYNILKSPVTQEGTNRANMVSQIADGKIRDADKVIGQNDYWEENLKKRPKYSRAQIALAAEYAVKLPDNYQIKEDTNKKTKETAKEVKEESPIVPKIEKVKEEKSNIFLIIDFQKISQILHYYFWQSFAPIYNQPVKGLNFVKANWNEFVHVFFLLCLIFIFRKDSALIYLAAAHLMILPFIGIIPAPFMSITWVSDQHLYLALPGLLAFWMRIIDKIKFKYVVVLPICFLIYFGFKTYQTTPYYKDQFNFYEASLDYNPTNVPIAFNYSFALAISGNLSKSQQVLDQTIDLSRSSPQMKKNIYFPHIVNLYLLVNKSLEVK